MRPSSTLYISSAQCSLGELTESAASAIQAGRLDADTAAQDGYLELPVSDRLAAPEMAVTAAHKALKAANLTPTRLGLLVHAWTYHQGHDFWSPAHFVARELGASNALALGVQQMCNGGAVGIEAAAAWLCANPELDNALITTADRFAEPGFDRWCADYGIAYGDGATALTLSRQPGPFQVLACRSVCVPELEDMHRGNDAFSTTPRWHSPNIDIRRTKEAFLAQDGRNRFATAAATAMRKLMSGILADANLTPDDPSLTLIALPRLGATVLNKAYRPLLASICPTPTIDYGRQTGHLGAGDTAANLATLQATKTLTPGQTAILLSAGGGFSWTGLIIQAR